MTITDEFGCVMHEVQPSGGRVFLGRAMLRRAQLQNFDLRGAVLSCADLRGANLNGADLSGALLDDADLTGASLLFARLDGANLVRTKLIDAKLLGVDLSSAVVQTSFLEDCPVFQGANLSNANLSGLTLRGNFDRANFGSANLTKTRLYGSLRHVELMGATLQETALAGDLHGASLHATDLSNILCLEFTGKRRMDGSVCWNPTTKWPPGLRGYRLAYHLMSHNEAWTGWIVAISAMLMIFLAILGAISSWIGMGLGFGVLATGLTALRVVYVRHKKFQWWAF